MFVLLFGWVLPVVAGVVVVETIIFLVMEHCPPIRKLVVHWVNDNWGYVINAPPPVEPPPFPEMIVEDMQMVVHHREPQPYSIVYQGRVLQEGTVKC